MPRIFDPEQLIYQLDVAMSLDPDAAPPDDTDYWKTRAALEIARQIESLEATIRAGFCEWRDGSAPDPRPSHPAPPEFADRFRCTHCGGFGKHAPDCPAPRLEARS